MSDLERMATLDFVIGVLREHERTLDGIGDRLEKSLKEVRQSKRQSKFILFSCMSWEDFKEVAKKSEAISFRVSPQVTARALKGNYMYEYIQTPISEDSKPTINSLPNDSEELRSWLARQLHVSKKKVIQGELSFFP